MKRDDLAPAVSFLGKIRFAQRRLQPERNKRTHSPWHRWNMEIHVPFDCVLIKVKQPLFKDKTFSKLRRGLAHIFLHVWEMQLVQILPFSFLFLALWAEASAGEAECNDGENASRPAYVLIHVR